MEETKREPTTSELLNIVKLLESTLKFYADESNYETLTNSPISRDKGYMARYALNEVMSISQYETSLLDEIKKISDQIEETGITETEDFDPEQFKNFINQLKQLSDSIKH